MTAPLLAYGLFGTYRVLPGIQSQFALDQYEAERQACNFSEQEGGAHVMARALIRIGRRFRGGRAPWQKARFPARVLFSVHDEILAMVREEVWEEADFIMKEEMERPLPELVGACGVVRGIRTDGGKPMKAWG